MAGTSHVTVCKLSTLCVQGQPGGVLYKYTKQTRPLPYYLKPEFESVTVYGTTNENVKITVEKYVDGRIRIDDGCGIDFFADTFTEIGGGFVASNPEHEFIFC